MNTQPRAGVDDALRNASVAYPFGGAITASAKWSFATRTVEPMLASRVLSPEAYGELGDLLLCRVERLGARDRLQLAEGRLCKLYEGDAVVLVRAAPGELETMLAAPTETIGEPPILASLASVSGLLEPCSDPAATAPAQTVVSLLGVLADDLGQPLNLAAHALGPAPRSDDIDVLLFAGASVDCGRTTALASLTKGLTGAGYRIAALKATGAADATHVHEFTDAGAAFVADFVDFGLPTTAHATIAQLEDGLDRLIAHAKARHCAFALVELADGLLQEPTRRLLARERANGAASQVVFAAPDAAAAEGACGVLRAMGIEPLALCGKLASSPLAAAEAAKATGLNVLSRKDLRDPERARRFIERAFPGAARRRTGAAAKAQRSS